MTDPRPAGAQRPLPKPTPETAHFWEGTRAGELRLQTCMGCEKTYFPPRFFCPKCGSRSVKMVKASGRATLYSYVIAQRPVPGFTPPYGICVVELEEGPRMMTNVVGCPQTPEALQLDMPLTVVFEPKDDTITLPLFQPAGEQVR
ncbi:OB-fold domain-containing protein [Sphingomonas sp. MG17]|uniref:OB-fold domain-containing protein n=1 Tax=Sphingomonas tagetis TaxID=2949092 RepID=A0A9X2KP57_9SPHN|nr:OB-fold domain-containing protein [Sphingomonas tagetis]MCP3730303.1 OB-fold domain-containing protein [Sphingomonas tagetis]